MKIAVLGFTTKGKMLGEKIASNLKNAVMVSNGKDFVRDKFNEYDAWIFVGAIGIAVRYIAPTIKSKTVDPAVIVVDELGNYIIPILSGHIGGGNILALEIERVVEGRAVITTATDINNLISIDSYAIQNNMKIANPENIKWVSSKLLENEKVNFIADIENRDILEKKEIIDSFEVIKNLDFFENLNNCEEVKAIKFGGGIEEIELPNLDEEADCLVEDITVGVCVSHDDEVKPFEKTLNLVPCNLVLGIGCRRNTSIESMREWIYKELKDRKISKLAISKVASIDIKEDEEAIIELAKELGVEFVTYTAEELQNVEGKFTPSEFVSSITGVDNVCERAALAGGGRLLIRKVKFEGKTFAIAKL